MSVDNDLDKSLRQTLLLAEYVTNVNFEWFQLDIGFRDNFIDLIHRF